MLDTYSVIGPVMYSIICIYILYISSMGEFLGLNDIIPTLAPACPLSIISSILFYFYFIIIITIIITIILILVIILAWRSLLI